MSFWDDKTAILGQGFMPRHKEIKNNDGSDLYATEEEIWIPIKLKV
jgi:hypothetical protein